MPEWPSNDEIECTNDYDEDETIPVRVPDVLLVEADRTARMSRSHMGAEARKKFREIITHLQDVGD